MITLEKLTPSSLCIRMSSEYTLKGVEPVARPNTTLRFSFCPNLTKSAISRATAHDASSLPAKTATEARSKRLGASVL